MRNERLKFKHTRKEIDLNISVMALVKFEFLKISLCFEFYKTRKFSDFGESKQGQLSLFEIVYEITINNVLERIGKKYFRRILQIESKRNPNMK
jgi:hypothetical protein